MQDRKKLIKFMLGDFYDDRYCKTTKGKTCRYRSVTKLPNFKFRKISEMEGA